MLWWQVLGSEALKITGLGCGTSSVALCFHAAELQRCYSGAAFLGTTGRKVTAAIDPELSLSLRDTVRILLAVQGVVSALD